MLMKRCAAAVMPFVRIPLFAHSDVARRRIRVLFQLYFILCICSYSFVFSRVTFHGNVKPPTPVILQIRLLKSSIASSFLPFCIRKVEGLTGIPLLSISGKVI